MKKIRDAAALFEISAKLLQSKDPHKKFVSICAGTGCRGYGCIKVKEELEAEIKKQKLDV